MKNNKFPLTLPERFDNNIIDAAKGILILLVIFGHASNFWTPEPFITFSIKFFHVACFLLFPFIYDMKPLTLPFIRDRFVRYYVPFGIFLLGYSILYFIAFGDILQMTQWSFDVMQAFFFGTAMFLDEASGLRALWFLPVLLSLTFISYFLIGNLKIHIIGLLMMSLLLHVTVGILPVDIAAYIPFGIVNAFYLLFLGLVVRWIVSFLKPVLDRLALVFLGLSILGVFLSFHFDTLIKFPVMALPDMHQPLGLVIHGLIIVSMFLFLITNKFLQRFTFLKWCGQNSLILYLAHLLFLAVSMQYTTKYFETDHVDIQSFLIVCFIFIFSFFGGTSIVFIIKKYDFLASFITPRTWEHWASTFRKKI